MKHYSDIIIAPVITEKSMYDRQQNVLKGQQKLLEDYKHRLDKAENELKRLLKAIYDFNEKARFYERKIKL